MLISDPRHESTGHYTGPHRYFLVFCTNSRRHVFTTRERVELVLLQIIRSGAEEQFAILAYCFMPDRLHLLIEGRAKLSDCRRFVSRAKQYSGYYYSKAFGQRLWQRYGVDYILRSHESRLAAARTVLEHPVRAGIARHVEDYPFLGSMTHSVHDILSSSQRFMFPKRLGGV